MMTMRPIPMLGAAAALILAAAAAVPALAQDHRGGMRGGPGEGPGGAMMLDGMFDRFDADGDGRITRTEVAAARAARIAALDADGDGVVTRNEALAFARAEASARAERMAGRMFDRLDADGDGRLTAAEALSAGPGGFGGGPGPAGMFDRLDRDRDGAVTRDEAEAGMARMRDGRGGPRHDGGGEGRGHGRHGG